MSMFERFAEICNPVPGLLPYDLDAAAGTGDWISLKNYHQVAILFIKAAGDAGEDPTLTIQQAQDVSGTGAKALNFSQLDVKQGAALTAVGTFTRTTQTATNTYTSATGGEQEAIWIVDFKSDALDVDNGFDCIRASLDDPGSGTGAYGMLLYLPLLPRYAGDPTPSAIAD